MITPPEIVLGVSTMVLSTTTPILLFLWSNKREQDKKHEENKERFKHLLIDRQYCPPHTHGETEGPLMAENVKYSPLKINGNNS